MERLLRPRSIAIVGISPEPGSIGFNCLRNLESFGYAGEIALVSRSRSEVSGRPCVPHIDDLPPGIDAALLCLPQAGIVDALHACVRRNIGAAVSFAAGFAETGEGGRVEQQRITEIARAAGMAFVGPNCMGFVNYVDGLPYFMHVTPARRTTSGPALAILAQSGGMMAVINEMARDRGLNVSYAVSTGNEAVTTVEDFLEAVLADERAGPVAMFVEQIRHPQRFLDLARSAHAKRRPIVLLHPGRSEGARASARSHTGAMAGDYEVMRAVVAHAGVVFVDTLDELIDLAAVMTRFPEPPAGGIGIFTDSGAYKGLSIDLCAERALELPVLAMPSVAMIAAEMPGYATVDNPLDLTMHALSNRQLYGAAAAAFCADPGVGCIVAAVMSSRVNVPILNEGIAFASLMATNKPAAVAFLGESALPADVVERLRSDGFPTFRSGERAIRAMAHYTRYGERLGAAIRRTPIAAPSAHPRIDGTGVIPEYRAKVVLEAAGIPIPAGALARSADEALAIAGTIGFPIVLKAQSPDLPHKSDVGGVVVGIADEAALRAGWQRMRADLDRHRPGLVLDGVLVESMSPRGVELVAGAKRDAEWGPVLLVGAGGILIEIIADMALLPADAARKDVADALARLNVAKLLHGVRGAPPADVEAVIDAVLRLGTLVREHAEIQEIDVNPLVALEHGKGVLALDALFVTA
jgi:acyl-CoA synthetase (NDP forming)